MKVTSVVGGMVAGADSIDDLDVLRHGGMETLFDGVRAPSTLGTFLRAFTHGHVRQLQPEKSILELGRMVDRPSAEIECRTARATIGETWI